MSVEVTLKGPVYTFQCYGINEAKQLGIVDSWRKRGTHAPVSTVFEQGDGKLLEDFAGNFKDAILIATGRHQIVVYRPRTVVREVEPEDTEEEGPAPTDTDAKAAPKRKFKRIHCVRAGHGSAYGEGIEGAQEYEEYKDVGAASAGFLRARGLLRDGVDWLFDHSRARRQAGETL